MSIRIALVGNPNCGKTTMFNVLTGANQYVGNWPGVTVEKKEGKYKKDKDVIITDLPGIYSLSPYTLEEVVSRDYLVKEKPEAILNIVDATNIERNLYLTTQIVELGIPVVIALNMMDVIAKNGDKINTERLGKNLGCTVVETSALKGNGLEEAVATAIKLAKSESAHHAQSSKVLDKDIETAIAKVDDLMPDSIEIQQRRWYAIKMLERDSKIMEQVTLDADKKNELEQITTKLEEAKDNDIESLITNARYDYIVGVVSGAVKKAGQKLTLSDKIDQIVTNRILGIPIFVLVMFLVYYIAVSTIGTYVTDFTNDTLFGEWIQPGVEGWLTSVGANDVLIDCVVNGVIGSIGAVLGFVPQMAIMFFLLSILEDIGYMARIAFIMDRVFRHFGLSGKSFIPLLISSGCGVPGILASKTIENDNDRRLTIMTATYVPCGAKLPVIALLGGVCAGAGNWWVAPVIYFIGVATVLVSAIILKKLKPFHGQAAPFVMELPAYHIPSAKTILMHVWERLWAYIKKVGTVLFIACVVMWFLSTYGVDSNGFGIVDQEYSLMAYLGKLLAWLFIPLGFGSWKAVASVISGFIAKESIVSTMTILTTGAEVEEAAYASVYGSVGTMFPQATMALSAFTFLVFNMLNSPCLAAISTMAKEMQSPKWTAAAIVFQNVNAWLIGMCIFQIGSLAIYGTFGVWTIIAFITVAAYLFMMFRKDPYRYVQTAAKRSVA